MHWRVLRREFYCLALVSIVCAGCGREKSPSASVADSSSTPKPPVYEGSVDAADYTSISGWAWDKNAPDQVIDVQVYDGDTLVGSVPANILRDDLLKAGKGNGRHAFHLPTPVYLKDGKEHSISARVAGTTSKLKDQSVVLAPPKPAPTGAASTKP
jgi:hypothetical protein